MPAYSFFRHVGRPRAIAILLILVAGGCTTAPRVAPPSVATLEYGGNQEAVEALDREIHAAGNDATKLDPIAARLIHVLREPNTTFAGRQAASQRLGRFPAGLVLRDDESRALFLAMLHDEQRVDFARLALDRIPGDAVDAVYVEALAKAAPGRSRLGIIQSAGNRRIAGAVDELTALLPASDYDAAAAAAKALGQIGTPEALRALEHAPVRDSSIVVEARLQAAHRIGGSDALAVYHEIFESSAAPANLRGAALRGLFELEPDHVAQRLIDAIDNGDPVIVPVLLECLATQQAPNLIPALASKLPTWTERTQVAVIAGLGRRHDPAAISVVSEAAENGSSDVRTAALTALGELPGSPEVAALLARHATAADHDEAHAARASLTRLNGPGVDETIASGAQTGDEPQRVVFIEQLAARYTTSAVPLLLHLRDDSNVAIRVAALGSLADLAPPDMQAALIAWAVAATDRNEQARAIRAVAAVTLRNPDVEARAVPVVQAIDQADSATAMKLLPILPRIGGTNAASAAVRLALRDDAALAPPAIASLVRWPDLAGLAGLVQIAEKTTRPDDRSSALGKFAEELQRQYDVPEQQLVQLIPRAVAVATNPSLRSSLVYFLGRCSGPEALTLAQKFKREPALAEDAADAILAIRSNRDGPPAIRASSHEDSVKSVLDGKPRTRWYAPARADQWLELDFVDTRPFRHLRLEGDGSLDNYPERLEVFVTDDDKTPGNPLAVINGRPGKIEITLPPGTRGKHLILRHTAAREDSAWAVSELLFD